MVESKTFYPPDLKTAEERLKFYAQHFNTVEVDSTFYALPARRNAELWAERTLSDFIFHIKAFGLVLVYRLDRLAPNTLHLLNAYEKLDKLGIGLRSMAEQFDTSTATGKFVMTMFASIAAHPK